MRSVSSEKCHTHKRTLRRSKGQPLFDHLVGAGEQIDASFKTESST